MVYIQMQKFQYNHVCIHKINTFVYLYISRIKTILKAETFSYKKLIVSYYFSAYEFGEFDPIYKQ